MSRLPGTTWRTGILLGLTWLGGELSAGAARPERKLPPIGLERGVFINACGASREETTGMAVTADAECVQSWLELRDVSGPHRLQVLYYDPAGNLYTATKEDWRVQPAKKKGYHKSAWVTHRLSIAGEQASILVGTWRVAVALDDITIGEGSFRIDRKPLVQQPELLEGRRLYLELQYEKAVERLEGLLGQSSDAGLRAEISWWLSLSLNALGRTEDARKTLVGLLQADPMFGISPADAKEAGGEELAVVLEELRSERYPDVYRKTAAPPQLELSKRETAPIIKKRRPLWKKLVYYVGIPVAVIGTLTVIGVAIAEDRLGNPPVLDLLVDETKAERLLAYDSVCEGQIPMIASLAGGFPPFDLLIVAAQVGGSQPAHLEGIGPLAPREDVVIFKQRLGGTISLELPGIDVQGAPPGSANIRFLAVLRDNNTPLKFDGVVVGQALPADVRDAVDFRDPLDRVVQQTLFEAVVSDCAQIEGQKSR